MSIICLSGFVVVFWGFYNNIEIKIVLVDRILGDFIDYLFF